MLSIVTPANSHDLTTLATLKRELQITVTDHDVYLAELICQASAAIASYCNRIVDGKPALARQSYRQTERPTAGPHHFLLAVDLIPTMTTISSDGEALDTDEFERDGALLYRLDASDYRIRWTAGEKVVIDYDAGFTMLTTLPAEIERACIETCKSWYEQRGRSGRLRSESAEGVGSVSYLDPARGGADLPADAADKLRPWRLLTWG